MIKKIALSIVLALIILVGLSAINLYRYNHQQQEIQPEKVVLDNFWNTKRINEKTEEGLLQILFSPTEVGRDRFGENIMIFKILKAHPNKGLVAEATIDKLYKFHEKEQLKGYIEKSENFGSPVYHSIDLLSEIATPNFAPRIGIMLEWDEVYLDDSRSTRINLVDTLEKIGTEKEIKYLLTFAKKVKKVDYDKNFPPKDLIYLTRYIEKNNIKAPKTENLRQYDQNDAIAAITAIKNRSN